MAKMCKASGFYEKKYPTIKQRPAFDVSTGSERSSESRPVIEWSVHSSSRPTG